MKKKDGESGDVWDLDRHFYAAIRHIANVAHLAEAKDEKAIIALRNLALFAEENLRHLIHKPELRPLVINVAKKSDNWPFNISAVKNALSDKVSDANPENYRKFIQLGKDRPYETEQSGKGRPAEFQGAMGWAFRWMKTIEGDLHRYKESTQTEILSAWHSSWHYNIEIPDDDPRICDLRNDLWNYIVKARQIHGQTWSNSTKRAEAWAGVALMAARVHFEGDEGNPNRWPKRMDKNKDATVVARARKYLDRGFQQLFRACR